MPNNNGSNEIDSLSVSIGVSVKEAISAVDQLRDSLAGLKHETAGIKSVASSVSHSVSKGSGSFKAFAKEIKGITQKAKNSVSSLARAFKNLFSTTSSGKSSVSPIEKLFKSIGRIAFYRAIRSAIKAVTQGFQEGIKNLYAYSELVGTKFKSSMDKMATSALYVKNAFAAMAAPLINVVAPIIDMIGDKVAALANKIAEFLAALTGQNVYTKAIKYAKDYNDQLKETAERIQRWLGSFDEINRMNDNSGSGSGSAVDYSKMFEEAVVSAEMSALVKKIIEAFKSADLSPIGKALSEKLKSVLDALDWTGIKGKAENIAKSITSFINGFFSTEGIGESIGRTIAEALNTAVTFAATLVSTLDWSSVGKNIGEAIRTFISTFDFELVGTGLHDFAIGLLDAIGAAIAELDEIDPATGMSGWDQLGVRIADALANIKFGEIIKKTFAVGQGIVKGVLSSVLSFLEESNTNGFWDELGTGIGEALANVDWIDLIGKIGSIGVNILQGIFTAIKSAVASGFGVDDETASFIVDGLAVGLLAAKVYQLFSKTKLLTGGFKDKNRSLSQQTQLTEAETDAVTDMSGVFGKAANVAVPGFVGAIVTFLGALGLTKKQTETTSDTVSAKMSSAMKNTQTATNNAVKGFNPLINALKNAVPSSFSAMASNVKAKLSNAFSNVKSFISNTVSSVRSMSSLTATGMKPLTNAISNTVPGAFQSMAQGVKTSLTNSTKTIRGFVNGVVGAVPVSFQEATDNVASNLEVSAKNEESYMATEAENWRRYNQNRANQAVQSARDIQAANNALKNGWGIGAAAILAGVALGALGSLSRAHGGGHGVMVDLQPYASGGFPTAGSMFIAGEAGAEFVGNIGGRTGVMNTEQMAAAMYNAMSAALANNPQGGDIYLDGEVIYRNTVRRNNNHVRAVGRSALLT